MISSPSPILARAKFACFCLAICGAALSVSVASIAIGAYAAILIFSWATEDRKSLPAFDHRTVLMLLLISLAVSTSVTEYPRESFMGLLKYSQGFLLFYAGVDAVRCRRDLWIAVGLLAGLELLAALSGIGQDLLGRDFLLGRRPIPFTAETTRITGPFKHANDFASFLLPAPVIAASLLIGSLKTVPGKARTLWGPFLLTAFIAVMGWALNRTMSRSAFLGLIAACALLMLVNRSWKGLAALGGIGAAALAIPSSFQYRLLQLVGGHGMDFGERWYLVRASVRMIADRPWFGLGPNTYSRWFSVYNPPDPSAPVQMYSHNSYLQMGTEIGLVGLSLYLLFIAAILFKTRPLRTEGPDTAPMDRMLRTGLWAALIALLVNALFESLLQSTQLRVLFWCLAGLLTAASREVRRA